LQGISAFLLSVEKLRARNQKSAIMNFIPDSWNEIRKNKTKKNQKASSEASKSCQWRSFLPSVGVFMLVTALKNKFQIQRSAEATRAL
jgi:hypothetical protein